VNAVLYEYFEDKISSLNNEEFKEYLQDLGWEVEDD